MIIVAYERDDFQDAALGFGFDCPLRKSTPKKKAGSARLKPPAPF